ncbi:MAG: S-formylglutathione hydrolase [Cellvibrionales bacterium]|nr:S-formylglutathione hydrolase [Cellvibrionales bacterium]
MECLSSVKCFEGLQQRFYHRSITVNCDMHFSVYLPPDYRSDNPMPVIYWLSGLTCTDQNFAQKAGAQRIAAKEGVIIVCPDTSPRGDDVPDDSEGAWDFGLGAGFYLNASQAPWSEHYQMYDYITEELPAIIGEHFSIKGKPAIMGHSMGGHGAITIGLKNLDRYGSISAFAPIVNPMDCPWGQKAFTHYLGSDHSAWQAYDSLVLLQQASQSAYKRPILIDQGLDDAFLESQLKVERFEALAKAVQWPMRLGWHEGYDHSYFFISTFIERHIDFHCQHF